MTDIADHALEALTRSGVREVLVLARRGPAQAAFTNPELRELGELADADVFVDAGELALGDAIEDPHGRRDGAAQRRDPARSTRRGARRRSGAAPRGAALPALAARAPRRGHASSRSLLARNELERERRRADRRARERGAHSSCRRRRSSGRSATAARRSPRSRSTSSAG